MAESGFDYFAGGALKKTTGYDSANPQTDYDTYLNNIKNQRFPMRSSTPTMSKAIKEIIPRLRTPWRMSGIFILLMLIRGGPAYARFFSFILSVLMIWKVLVPCCLNGMNPIIVGGLVTAVLTVMIIALVFGFDRRCLSACMGAGAGILLACILDVLFTSSFKIHGAVMPFSESLLYSGFENLNLTQIFMASIFIGSSGAMMDLVVDVTAAVHEVLTKRPDLSRLEAMKSGLHVGQAAMGTLLLAYSGSYIALLMVFMAQGTPLINIMNYRCVASEIIHTLVGSLGLVAAAPLTAFSTGLFLAHPKHLGAVREKHDRHVAEREKNQCMTGFFWRQQGKRFVLSLSLPGLAVPGRFRTAPSVFTFFPEGWPISRR